MKLLLLLFFLNQHPADTAAKSGRFIAMEYKGMSNCIYEITINDSLIMGAKVNGYITVQPNFGIGTSVPRDVMHNPEAYVNKKKAAKYMDKNMGNDQFISTDGQNFIIRRKDVKSVFINTTPKWGMGYYPQSGRIMIESPETAYNKTTTRDLILVGDQNAEEVLKMFKLRSE